jgi:hypothetical protein
MPYWFTILQETLRMRNILSMALFLGVIQVNAQIINGDFDDWQLVYPGGQPYYDPVGWKTNNEMIWTGAANTPVIPQYGIVNTFAQISSIGFGIDAQLPGELSQRIPTTDLYSITHRLRCDSLDGTGRCVVSVFGEDRLDVLYSDSLAVKSGSAFVSESILVPDTWRIEYDSITLFYEAYGLNDMWDSIPEGFAKLSVDAVELELISGVDDFTAPVRANLFPNPVTDVLQIEIASGEPIRSIALLSLIGTQFFAQTINTDRLAIDVSALPGGLYFLHIDTGRDRVVRSVVKR